MKQEVRQLKDKQLAPKDQRGPSGKVVTAVILCSLVTGVTVDFLNTVHYSNEVSQADSKATASQMELGKEQSDVKFLISNSSNQFNCYDLHSDYARNLCYEHESLQGGTRL